MSVKPKPIAIGVFWVAPILGAVIGAIIYKVVAGDKD
jgi:glycerol uptake facilitator-like aquaporin